MAEKRKRTKRNYSAQADKLFSQIVRSVGVCQSGKFDDEHNGPLQCAHGISRRYRAVRWDRRNAWCLCAKHHQFYTHHPLEWDLFLRHAWGEAGYYEMRALALAGVKPDLPSLVASLKEQVAA